MENSLPFQQAVRIHRHMSCYPQAWVDINRSWLVMHASHYYFTLLIARFPFPRGSNGCRIEFSCLAPQGVFFRARLKNYILLKPFAWLSTFDETHSKPASWELKSFKSQNPKRTNLLLPISGSQPHICIDRSLRPLLIQPSIEKWKTKKKHKSRSAIFPPTGERDQTIANCIQAHHLFEKFLLFLLIWTKRTCQHVKSMWDRYPLINLNSSTVLYCDPIFVNLYKF